MTITMTLLAIVTVVFLAAGYIKGVIGLGLPTIATALLGIFITPAEASSIVVVPAILTNIWQMWNGPHLRALLKRLAPLLIGIIVATVASAGIIARANVKLTVAALGLALILYALYALYTPRLSLAPQHERPVGLLAGLVTGVISGSTGVFVIPSVPYLQALGLDKTEMVQAIGIGAFTSAAALAIGLGVHGSLSRDVAIPATVAVVAGLAGMGLGQVLRDKLSLEAFRRWVLYGLIGLGATMVARLL